MLKEDFRIDIQLFGDEDTEIEDIEIEDEIEIEDDSEEDPEEDPKEDPEETAVDEPEDKKELPADVVPKKALLAERAKYQRRLKELKAELEKSKGADETKKKLDELGLDESVAETLASLISNSKSKADNVEALVNRKFRDLEFENLKSDPFYSDAEEHREELEEMAEKTGMSVRQCYNALFGDKKFKLSQAELRSQIEQEVLANIKKRQEYGNIDTTENGNTEVKSKLKLTKDEVSFAKAAGMTPAEYAAFKNAKDVSQFEKILKKKKG